MPDAAIITAVYGAYDVIKPVCPQDGTDCEHILVTDDETLGEDHLGWRVVLRPRPGVSPMRAAKCPKLCPWEYTAAPASVWVDGSVIVTSPRFAGQVLDAAAPLAQFAHPDRDCIYEEAVTSSAIAKYAGEPVMAQARHYRLQGHPEHWGLWAATVIARHHTPQVRDLGEQWTAEVGAWSFQDQVSQPYVLRNLGLRPAVLPGCYRDNCWLRLEGSGKHW